MKLTSGLFIVLSLVIYALIAAESLKSKDWTSKLQERDKHLIEVGASWAWVILHNNEATNIAHMHALAWRGYTNSLRDQWERNQKP